MTLISGSKNDYQCVVTGDAVSPTLQACTSWANRAKATYGFAFPSLSTGFQFDLTSHSLMRTSSKTVSSIDQYGNVLAETSSNVSNFDDGATETRASAISRAYETDATLWWVNKLLKQSSTAAAVVGTGTRALSASLFPNLNPARSSTLVYGYHANRQVECEAMIPGPYTTAVTSASCASTALAPSALVGTAADGSVERRSKSSFDGFGNVSGVSSQARGEAPKRRTATFGRKRAAA